VTGERARAIAAAVAIAVGMAGVVAVAIRWSRRGDPEATLPRPPQVVVVAAKGRVERGGGARWSPVAVGDRLRAPDAIRTGAAATAEIQVGDARIVLAERSHVAVREITAALQRFGGARGRIVVERRDDGTRLLRIEGDHGAAAQVAGRARYAVLATANAFTVAAESGLVRVESGGRAVELRAGQATSAWRARPPIEPRPVRAAELVRVLRKIEALDRALCVVVRGRVDLGAEVLVDGEPVAVDEDGAFAVRVPRRPPTKRSARLQVRDVSGRTSERDVPCTAHDDHVDAFEVRWDLQ
jgi:hypothetical protein